MLRALLASLILLMPYASGQAMMTRNVGRGAPVNPEDQQQVPAPATPAIDKAVEARLLANVADQVRKCYVGPRVAMSFRQIVSVFVVRYNPDGSLAVAPELVRQSGVTSYNASYASLMANAAAEAIRKCSPVRMPSEYYAGGWDELELSFSPRGMA